jgi:hypothetical protein
MVDLRVRHKPSLRSLVLTASRRVNLLEIVMDPCVPHITLLPIQPMEATNVWVPHRPTMHVLIAESPARILALVMAHLELPYITRQQLTMAEQAVLICRPTLKRVGIVELLRHLLGHVMGPAVLRFTIRAMPPTVGLLALIRPWLCRDAKTAAQPAPTPVTVMEVQELLFTSQHRLSMEGMSVRMLL